MISLRSFWASFMSALAAIASAVTLISYLIGGDTSFSDFTIIYISIGIVIICLVYSVMMTWQKKKIQLKFNPKFSLTIEKGDLFEATGIIVIPVNEYFDTIVDREIISTDSVHGKFINRYWHDRLSELNQKIEETLNSINAIEIDNDRPRGNKSKYDIGTCVDIRDGQNIYVLFAMTHFDKDNHAYLDRKEFPKAIDGLMKHLEHIAVDYPVYMPLFGTGLSRLKRSPQRILIFLIDALDFKHSDLTFPHGISVELTTLTGINLNKIEENFLGSFHNE